MTRHRDIRWLHLSDTHFGARGTEIWHQVHDEFRISLEYWLPKIGTVDLILFTGDLVFSGQAAQYRLVEDFIEELNSMIVDLTDGPAPILVPVPGNHDLARPSGLTQATYSFFKDYANSTDDIPETRILNETFWQNEDTTFLNPLFSGYANWFRTLVQKQAQNPHSKFHESQLPGDFCLELDLPGTFPLCIVGLNSAWLQFSGDDFLGKLAIPTRQFHAVLPKPQKGNPLDLFARRRALMMMHHPPGWLSNEYRKSFFSEIFLPTYFDALLYGHMHEGHAQSIRDGGGPMRHQYQSPSLCGIEKYGSSQETRAFGFSFGSLSKEGELRVWPFRREKVGGIFRFTWDNSFGDEREYPQGVLFREADKAKGPGVRDADKAKGVGDLNLTRYLNYIDQT